MANNLIELPVTYFGDPNKGRPLFNAKIYVGDVDTDPRTPANQKQIVGRQEDGTEVNLPQPVRTNSGGYPTYNGSVVTILVSGSYSLAVDDRNDSQQYYFSDVTNGEPLTQADVGTAPNQIPTNADLFVDNVTSLRALTGLADGQVIYLKGHTQIGVGGGELIVIGDQTTEVDNNGTVFIVDGKVIERPLSGDEYNPEIFGNGKTETEINSVINNLKFANLSDENYTATTKINLSDGDSLSGGPIQQSGTISTNQGVSVSGAYSTIKNLRINTADSAEFAISIENPSGFSDFGNHIDDVRLTGLKGLSVAGFETKLENLYLTGNGNEIAGGRGIDITQYDTSIDNVLVQEYESGVDTFQGLQANDLHIVRCRRALTFREQGGPSQLVNTFIDTPSEYGVRCFDQGGVQMVNTYFLRTGTTETADTAAAIFLDIDSKENSFICANFIQPDLTTITNLINHQSGSVDNLYFGIRGDYKMDDTVQRERMRNQCVVGAMGDWARFNNIPRKSRGRSSFIASASTAVIDFHLDFEYNNADTFNTVLFYGKYVSRTLSSEAAFGDIFIPISYDDFGCSPVISKTSGDSNNNWTIVSATLDGNTLSVTVQNDSTNSSSISIELERSIDAAGKDF